MAVWAKGIVQAQALNATWRNSKVDRAAVPLVIGIFGAPRRNF